MMRNAIGRVMASMAGASLAAMVGALLEARWMSFAAAEPPPFGALFGADLGLVHPIALAVGIGVGIGSLLLHPTHAPSMSGLSAALSPASSSARARVGALALLSPIAALLWTIVSARIGLAFLSTELAPKQAAAAGAFSSLLVGLVLWALVLGGARALGGPLERRSLSPLACLGAGVGVFALGLGVSIATGTTSGAGGTLAIFGVMKRPELDLRAPGLLMLFALAAYGAPALIGRLPMAALAFVAFVPLVATWRTAGISEHRVSTGLERDAPLGKISLVRFRKLFDHDHDGFSSRFGGGDCNDDNPAFNPGAEDIPGNGIDEDCSGKDAELVKLEGREAEAPKDAREWALAKIPDKLNVVLLTIDTLRYDLGYTGNPKKISPRLDELAQKSVVFEKAYALASYTSKSLPPALIGKYPSETHRGWSHFNRFEKSDTFIQERLQKAGIRTLSVQGYWYFFQDGVGFERGFDVIDSSAAPKSITVEGDRSYNSEKLSDAAIAEFEKPENTGKQFFAWIHYVDPHAEYVKHEGFDFGSSSRDLYDSEVAYVDHHVGRVIDAIKKSPFAERTAIVVTSDHGEAFGEHGMIRHGFEEWEELIRVPWIVQVPGLEPRRVNVRRSAIDLVPTLLDLYRLPLPKGEGTDFLSGQSLLLDLANPPGYVPKERIIFSHMAAGPNNADRQAFIDEGLKLIASDGRPMGLYELEKDPDEKHDLLDDAALKEKVMGRYKAFLRELREVKVKPQ